MSGLVTHIVYPLGRLESPLQVRATTHEGTVDEVAEQIQRGLESHGHVIAKEVGDFTGPNGTARALTWLVTVTLKDTGYTAVWQHIVRDQDDAYKRIEAAR